MIPLTSEKLSKYLFAPAASSKDPGTRNFHVPSSIFFDTPNCFSAISIIFAISSWYQEV